MTLPLVLDVAIGLAFVYLAMSALCSGINEVLAERLGRRGRFLREGLLNLAGDRWTYLKIIYHPIVAALYRDVPGKPRPPSYLPPGAFATAALDAILLKAARLAARSEPAAPAPGAPAVGPPTAPKTYASVREALVACDRAGDFLAAALLPIVDGANGNLDLATRQIGAWYEASMERVSGWYKRYARVLLFFIGLAVAVVANVDSIQIGTALARSSALRDAIAPLARQAVETGKIDGACVVPKAPDGSGRASAPAGPAERSAECSDSGSATDRVNGIVAALAKLEPLGLPVGFTCLSPLDTTSASGLGKAVAGCLHGIGTGGAAAVLSRLAGWLLTALAVSLGAPFWFDLLNRLVDLRGAGKKPPERSTAGAPRF